ncbi:MAG: ABC transporter ATP-binding protein [Chloroflexota bacterium]
MSAALLTLDGVHTYYGESHVLHGVSLEVRPGELVSLLGRNGAGKTTTMRSIMGLNTPRSGHVMLQGKDVTHAAPHRRAAAGIGLVPQGRRIFAPLSVRENLVFAQRKGSEWTLDKIYELFPRLKERQDIRGTSLSGGEQQMLAIGRALLMNPRLLLMDEPSEGLAPLIVKEIGRVISDLKTAGIAILLAEQNLALALSVADRCYVLNKGQVVHSARPAELRRDDDVKRRFLGV